MAGLRERKKQKTRDDIIRAAQEAFISGGYSGVSMEEIAEKAGIGVGTLYNYFKSKADIFLSIMHSDLELRDMELAADISNNDPAEVILAYLKQMSAQLRRYDKRVWRDLFAALFGASRDIALFDGLMRTDMDFIGWVTQMLDKAKEKGALPSGFLSGEAAMAAYSVVITQAIIYVYDERMTFDQLTERVENQIRFLFREDIKHGI